MLKSCNRVSDIECVHIRGTITYHLRVDLDTTAHSAAHAASHASREATTEAAHALVRVHEVHARVEVLPLLRVSKHLVRL